MMDGRMLHRMMNDVATVMDDTPVMNRMMDLGHCKAGQGKK